MKDPKNITELNELFKLLEMAFMVNSTRVRTLTALRARLLRAKKQKMATIVSIKIQEYRTIGGRSRSKRGEIQIL